MKNENCCENECECANCKCKAPMIVGALIFSLIMLAFGVFLGKTYSTKQNTGAFAIPTPIVSSPTVQPTASSNSANSTPDAAFADWKTYSNDKFGFSIKHPNEWFSNDNISTIYFSKQQISTDEMKKLTHGIPGSFEILIYDNNKNYESQWKDFNENTKLKNSIKDINGKEYAKIEKILLDGKEAFKVIQFAEADMASVGGFTTSVWFESGGNLIQLNYPNIYNNNKEFNYSIFDQILSTFKFL